MGATWWLQALDIGRSHCMTSLHCRPRTPAPRPLHPKVVPIYGRGREGLDPRTLTQPREPTKAIPSRPLGQRAPPVVRAAAAEAQQAQQGMGLMPALFGLQPGAGGGSEPLTQEQQHQAFLSRLLLMLGSFVIMCLLLF